MAEKSEKSTEKTVEKSGRNTQYSRRRLSIPWEDTTVVQWCDEQYDLSASFRIVVRDYIRRNGLQDVTCAPVTQEPRKGRPPKNFNDVQADDESVQSAQVDVIDDGTNRGADESSAVESETHETKNQGGQQGRQHDKQQSEQKPVEKTVDPADDDFDIMGELSL